MVAEKTGEVIPELKDESPLKIKAKTVSVPAEQPKKTEKPLTDDRTIIKVSYSLWAGKEADKPEWKGCDVFYRIDENGKHTRMFDSDALELIASGRAVLQVDYESIGQIEFVLIDESSAKAFLLNKKGDRRNINFKDALKLVMNGKARISDIKIE